MSAPTVYDVSLAKRTRDGLAYLRQNQATDLELELYLAEVFADYRTMLLPHGRGERRGMNKVKADMSTLSLPWRQAYDLATCGKKKEARALLKEKLNPNQLLPKSRLVIQVMLAVMDDTNDGITWNEKRT